MTNRAWVNARGARWLVLAFAVYGCNSDVHVSRSTGESHFLDYCDSTCGNGLDCISGVCTRACLVSKHTCGDLAEDASCTDQSVEPGNVAVCDVECTVDADCDPVAKGHRCDGGYCRGGDPLPNGQGGEGGASPGTGGTAPTGGAAPTGGTGGNAGGSAGECSRGIMSFTRGDGSDRLCESCHCTELTACEPIDCDRGLPIYPCSEADLEEVPEQYELPTYPHFDGDTLVLEHDAGGGCESHTVSLCFDPAFQESNPVQTSLRLRHDMTGIQICAALFHETVRFDLSPLRRYYEDGYGTSTGVISTNYGPYGFGDLSCDERRRVSSGQAEEAADATDNRCTVDDDCSAVWMSTSCAGGCQAMVRSSEAEELETEIARIGAAVCDSCEPLPTDCQPAAARCVDGVCTRADE